MHVLELSGLFTINFNLQHESHAKEILFLTGVKQANILFPDAFQVIQMNKLPLIVTFIGTEDCNTGHVLALEDEMDNYLEEIKQTVTEA